MSLSPSLLGRAAGQFSLLSRLASANMHPRFLPAVPNYDVSPDGRFLMIASQIASETPVALSVVLNWYEELKQRAPAR